MRCRLSSFVSVFILIAVNAQDNGPEIDACPAPEPEWPTITPSPPPLTKPWPTPSPSPTPGPSAPFTPCMPCIPSTATETATITEPPETVTSTTTETSTATVTTEVPVTCMDHPPASYDLGTCGPVAPRIRGTYSYSVLFGGTNYLYGDLPRLMDTICTRLQDGCQAPESSVQRCRAAEAAANQFTGDEAVAAWNEIMAPCVTQPAVRKLRGRNEGGQSIGSRKTETITGLKHSY
ncbi:hypothetical protein PVAR5_0520 [Paecilomyces variotii No. 5]|uniref:Uncharacterized protein n=1 Tax=Byssochlamys spectabilis (strain No. 5 / NBRC 109023) TaxID=1356009 RepID=V5FTL0_BYSSN|nr:hypothetical protein PVAR5_0520 [Paecilomyces variotii No. 5]